MAFDKKAHITSLIGNGWVETDRAALEAMSDTVLEKIKPTVIAPVVPPIVPVVNVAPVPVVPPTVPTPSGPMTLQAFLAGAPLEVRNQIERGLKAEKDRKDQLVTLIIGNTQTNPVFTKEFLDTKTVEELEGWAMLLQQASPQQAQVNNGMFVQGYIPGQPNYGGAVGTAPFVRNANQPVEAPLVMPDIFPAAAAK